MLLRVSEDLGVTYEDEGRDDDLARLINIGQVLTEETGVAVRWVVVDDNDHLLAWCAIMDTQIEMLKRLGSPGMIATNDLYMKQLAERLPGVKAITSEEALNAGPDFLEKLKKELESTYERTKVDPLFREEVIKGIEAKLRGESHK